MTLLTVLLHIWILWSLYGDKVTAGQNQINCLCCYPERSAVSKSCARYVQCGMKYNTSDRTECILGSTALCTCFCCDKDCYTKTVCPTINASICTRQIVYCTNTTTTRFKPTSRSNNVEMSASTTSQNVFSSTDVEVTSHQMSYSSGQNHIPEPTATFSSVTMSPTEPSKFNQRIFFALVGGLGGIIIVLILSLIIMVQCVTLHRRRKIGECPSIRDKMMTSKDEEKEYSNPEYAAIGITLAEPCQSTSMRESEVQSCQLYAQVEDDRHQSTHRAGITNLCAYEDRDKYFKSPNDEDYVNPGYEVSEKRGEKKQPQTNCNVQLPVTSTTHAVDKKEKLTIESAEYETVCIPQN